MLTDEVGGNGEALKAGQTYNLEDASADHWLKRRKAELANLEETGDEEPEDSGKPSDGLTVAQIKEALEAKKIEIPEGVTLKADLAKLLDEAE
ncbi:hypothetical protein [Variovorax paradoxus]|uniref:hypothetical protein n=1 Tax=Variovorax paradoxus TaxID=34073 RepID=UPI001934AF58|nr:hypothetical protein INQ48_20455 [Variovorax paradoxus]